MPLPDQQSEGCYSLVPSEPSQLLRVVMQQQLQLLSWSKNAPPPYIFACPCPPEPAFGMRLINVLVALGALMLLASG